MNIIPYLGLKYIYFIKWIQNGKSYKITKCFYQISLFFKKKKPFYVPYFVLLTSSLCFNNHFSHKLTFQFQITY